MADAYEFLERLHGPVTTRSRAGLMPETASLRSSDAPSEVALRAKGFRDPGAAEKTLEFLYDMGLQPVRTGEAVGEALIDPTLANVTNAGVQSAITAFRPAAAAGVYGIGLLEGARRDAGVSAIAPATAAKKRETFKAVELPGLTPEQNAQYNEARRRIAAGDFRSGAERRTLEADANRLADLSARFTERQSDAEREAESAKEAQRQAEYGRSVETAEGAYDREMARDRRFSDSELGKVWAKTGPLTPMLFGAGAGALARLTGHSPYLHGTLAGALSSNIPLIGDAIFTEADNPKRRAYESLLENLPPAHPRRAEVEAMLADEGRLPRKNPIREEASKELYDPVKLAERLGLGALEGLGGGAIGGHVIDVPGVVVTKAARLPGHFRKNFRESWNEPVDLPPISGTASVRPPASPELPSLGSVGDVGRSPLPRQPKSPERSKSERERNPKSEKGQKSKKENPPSATPEQQNAASDELKRFLTPPQVRKFASGGRVDDQVHAGPLHSTVAGRTDHLPISVVAGSYVLPADIISALGEGNTNSGMQVVQSMFPTQPRKLEYARGGKVPIAAAGGEYVLTPEQVAAVGGGDIEAGHEILDDWVRQTRAHTINTLSSLPGPAR